LYPTLAEKAATLCLALVHGHSVVDGNKRVGHAAMETFLMFIGDTECSNRSTVARIHGRWRYSSASSFPAEATTGARDPERSR
jgi:hypothetical protein